MAEGLATKHLKNNNIKSAGTNPVAINSVTVEVMKEIDIDISEYQSKSISNEEINEYDIVVTLCGSARDQCVRLEKNIINNIHLNIDDPAKIKGSKTEKIHYFRIIRDQIEKMIKKLANDI